MSSKAQYTVVKEILNFSIGIVVVISFSLFISNLMIPNIREFVFLKKIDNAANYLDSSLLELYLLSERTSESNITLDISMPESIADSRYSVTADGRLLCVVLQDYGSSKCISSSLPAGISLSGYYLSGTDLKFSLLKSGSISISLLNAN